MKRAPKIAGLAVLVAVASAMGVAESLDYRNRAEFDAAIWRNPPRCEPNGCDVDCVRGRMVRDLTGHYLKPGMSRSDVMALLGNPQLGSSPAKASLSYDLGMCSGFRMDYDSLVLSFDESDALIDIRTQQH